MRSADSISVPSFALNYTSISADTDLVAAANTRLTAIGRTPIQAARRIYVGTAGNISVGFAGDPATAITYTNLAQGAFITGNFVTIFLTGTTVTYLTVEY